jgi:hypothetical protein
VLVKTGRRHFLGRLIDPVRCDHEAPDSPSLVHEVHPRSCKKRNLFMWGMIAIWKGRRFLAPTFHLVPEHRYEGRQSL